MAELFLVKCLKLSTEHETFNDLHVDVFNSNGLNLDFKKIYFCTSVYVHTHIPRAYYQQQFWVQALFEDMYLFIKECRLIWLIRRGSLLVPDIVVSKPEELSDPT